MTNPIHPKLLCSCTTTRVCIKIHPQNTIYGKQLPFKKPSSLLMGLFVAEDMDHDKISKKINSVNEVEIVLHKEE